MTTLTPERTTCVIGWFILVLAKILTLIRYTLFGMGTLDHFLSTYGFASFFWKKPTPVNFVWIVAIRTLGVKVIADIGEWKTSTVIATPTGFANYVLNTMSAFFFDFGDAFFGRAKKNLDFVVKQKSRQSEWSSRLFGLNVNKVSRIFWSQNYSKSWKISSKRME